MTINLKMPDIQELKPRITVFGVGGAGGNAVNNMITAGLQGCDFVVANTDAQALAMNHAERLIQMGVAVTEGLGAGSQPEVGSAAAEEVIDEINDHLSGSHMVFITAGMGGGTGTGAAPVIARAARAQGILTVGVVTKPFQFEGARRMRIAEAGIQELQRNVDTLIVIPNQNLFRIANAQTTFADAFAMADQVLYSGVACITDLMVKEGLINLDFADVRSIMRGMGKAMMGTGEASGENRAQQAAEAAIANPLLDETSMKGAKGLLISITGGNDLTLFEVDEAATRIREEVDADANIILGATFDESMDGIIRVSVVATGIDKELLMGNGEFDAIPAPKTEPVARPVINTAPRQPERPVERPAVTSFQQDAASRALASLERELAINEPAPAAQVSEAVEAKSFRPAAEAVIPAPVQAEMPAAPLQPMMQQPVQAAVPFETPAAEQPMAAPRMPRVEDFPPIAQRELMARQPQRPEAVAPAAHAPAPQPMAAPALDMEEHGDDRRPMGLLRRLASGLSRREDHDEHAAHEAAPVMTPRAPAAAPQPQMRPAPRMPQMAPAQQGRPAGAAGQLDMQGRAPARPQVHSEEDQLEIPAFLRRQSN
ncbi:cell division protein FtsZ [Pannonibacter phragmitetus]|uniref:cell division protein FtsZ n=1 Tax=Pannonibacter phragmitetus TaxID=121719 RepID=UPI000F01926C|nr:cell division protein FtsZ [Pannonibacter phragmitetus]